MIASRYKSDVSELHEQDGYIFDYRARDSLHWFVSLHYVLLVIEGTLPKYLQYCWCTLLTYHLAPVTSNKVLRYLLPIRAVPLHLL